MKILSLNIWGGKERDALLSFIERMAPAVDVFCFQEMLFGEDDTYTLSGARRNIYLEIKSKLPDFIDYSYFAPLGSKFEGESLECVLGQSIFVKKSYAVTGIGGFRTYPKTSPIVGNGDMTLTGNCQWLTVGGTTPTLIANIHALAQRGSDKRDTPERLEQSEIMKGFLDTRTERKVLIGDFNMRPDIESMKILTRGMKDLIAEYGITSTRSSGYDKPVKHSDYALVSEGAHVANFSVLPDEVSDHLPLLLELR